MRTFVLLGFVLILGGCSTSGPPSTGTVATTPTDPFLIVERVYHEGWRTSGEISISETGHYSWAVYDIWSSPEQSQTFTGQLPETTLQSLISSSSSFEVRDGVRTYELGIDDSKTIHPAGVNALRAYLFATHMVDR